jgi:hypothetical protein
LTTGIVDTGGKLPLALLTLVAIASCAVNTGGKLAAGVTPIEVNLRRM